MKGGNDWCLPCDIDPPLQAPEPPMTLTTSASKYHPRSQYSTITDPDGMSSEAHLHPIFPKTPLPNANLGRQSIPSTSSSNPAPNSIMFTVVEPPGQVPCATDGFVGLISCVTAVDASGAPTIRFSGHISFGTAFQTGANVKTFVDPFVDGLNTVSNKDHTFGNSCIQNVYRMENPETPSQVNTPEELASQKVANLLAELYSRAPTITRTHGKASFNAVDRSYILRLKGLDTPSGSSDAIPAAEETKIQRRRNKLFPKSYVTVEDETVQSLSYPNFHVPMLQHNVAWDNPDGESIDLARLTPNAAAIIAAEKAKHRQEKKDSCRLKAGSTQSAWDGTIQAAQSASTNDQMPSSRGKRPLSGSHPTFAPPPATKRRSDTSATNALQFMPVSVLNVSPRDLPDENVATGAYSQLKPPVRFELSALTQLASASSPTRRPIAHSHRKDPSSTVSQDRQTFWAAELDPGSGSRVALPGDTEPSIAEARSREITSHISTGGLSPDTMADRASSGSVPPGTPWFPFDDMRPDTPNVPGDGSTSGSQP